MTGSRVKTGRWGSSGNNTVGWCRVTVGSSKLADSGAGFTAWTNTTADTAAGRTYSEHKGEYCDCTGHGECSKWAFDARDYTEADCQSKCDELLCDCFDFNPSAKSNAIVGTGVSGSGPLVLFEATLKTSLVISSASNFMVASQAIENNTLAYGIMGSVATIPSSFSVETIVVLSSGVNAAMDSWGSILLARYGKVRSAYRRDFATQWLGYSTDNGAYVRFMVHAGLGPHSGAATAARL